MTDDELARALNVYGEALPSTYKPAEAAETGHDKRRESHSGGLVNKREENSGLAES